MPWKIIGTMDQKIQLIADWQTKRLSITDLSRKYGISRPIVYKWLGRYEEQGIDGLREQSRVPLNSPNQTREEIVQLIIGEKLKNRKRGPKKVYYQLKENYPDIELPAPSTIGKWLNKFGLVNRRRKRLRVSPYNEPFQECQEPNDVWSADYKGQFKMGNEQVCYPLTISDNCSRYLIECQGLEGPRYKETRDVFKKAFRENGIPTAIRSDNGIPFAGKCIGGLSRLSIWWIQLGIVPERIDKGCPQQNGRHERMHRTLKEEALDEESKNIEEQQERFDRFRYDYNMYRPHEALGQQAPIKHYRKSTRPCIEKPITPEYDVDYETRQVMHGGEIKFRNKAYYLTELLRGQPIGLKEVDDGRWAIYYSFMEIGTLDLRENKIIR